MRKIILTICVLLLLLVGITVRAFNAESFKQQIIDQTVEVINDRLEEDELGYSSSYSPWWLSGTVIKTKNTAWGYIVNASSTINSTLKVVDDLSLEEDINMLTGKWINNTGNLLIGEKDVGSRSIAFSASNRWFYPREDSQIDNGRDDRYWKNTYSDTLYLNPTAFFSGATAGVVALTGDLTVSGSATTSDRHYIGTQLSVATSSPVEGYEVTVVGDSYFTGDHYQEGRNTTTLSSYLAQQVWLGDRDGNYDKLYHADSYILNGLSEHKQDLYIVVEGGRVYLETERIGGGDLEYVFNETASDLDCTTGPGVGGRARVQLTQGTTDNPQINYVYLTNGSGTATMTAATTFPTVTVGMIASVSIWDDTKTTSDGPAQLQRWTMSLKHDNENNFSGDVNGTIYWMQRKLRALGARYESGIALTTDDTAGVIDLTAGGGVVYQLHPQDWPSKQISVDGIYVANASGVGTLTNYEKLTDLADVDELADGTSITNNRYFSVVVWGAMNSSESGSNQSKLYFNLPTDWYNSVDGVIADANNYDVRTVPDEFSTTGFLIARLTMQRKAGGNIFVGNEAYSLLGQLLGSQGGGSGSVASNSFSDAQWNIFNDTDPTKIGTLDLSTVTTGNTRDLIWPDSNGTLALLELQQTFTAEQLFTGGVRSNVINATTSNIDNLISINATTTSSFHSPEICISNDCRTSWPAGGGGGGAAWEATSTPGFDANMITPTTTNAGLIVNGNSTTTGSMVIGDNSASSIPGCLGVKATDGIWVFGTATSSDSVIALQGLFWSKVDCSGSSTSTLLIGQ